MDHATEMERISAAEDAAQEIISKLPREVVESLGVSNLLSDLTHDLLLRGGADPGESGDGGPA